MLLLAQTHDEKINNDLKEIGRFMEKCYFEENRDNKLDVKYVTCPDIYVPDGGNGCATTAPYTNSLILNNCVYVPIADEKYEAENQAALKAYREAYSGKYKIYGIRGKKGTPWLGTDALHCRTNTIPRAVVDRWLKSQRLDSDKTASPVIWP